MECFSIAIQQLDPDFAPWIRALLVIMISGVYAWSARPTKAARCMSRNVAGEVFADYVDAGLADRTLSREGA
jgi:hypothetical protein